MTAVSLLDVPNLATERGIQGRGVGEMLDFAKPIYSIDAESSEQVLR